jgi:osmotically-inducible protein OsmY
VASDVATSGVDERTVGTMAADTRIRTEINEAWFQHDLTMFRKVGLVVHERRVLLTGIMQTRSMKDDAVRLARQIGGVREVIDEILVEDEAPGVMDLAWDNWIVTELRRKITFDSVTSRSIANYRIDAVNGTVYLIGIARDQAELDRVIDHARTLSHVRRVVSHVLLRDDPRRFRDA